VYESRFDVANFALRIDVHGIMDKIPDRLPNGTGFLLATKQGLFLATCWHVVTNKNPTNGRFIAGEGSPTDLGVWFRQAGEMNSRLKAYYPLYNEGRPSFYAHPNPRAADLALLPITCPEGTELNPIRPQALGGAVALQPCAQLAVPGFPLGLHSSGDAMGFGGHPICKTVHLATSIEANHNGRQVALVDGTARGGMSGSPVMFIDGSVWICCGIYSAQDSVSELGEITKITALTECLREAKLEPRSPVKPDRIRRTAFDPGP
jgi:hypothetical protein